MDIRVDNTARAEHGRKCLECPFDRQCGRLRVEHAVDRRTDAHLHDAATTSLDNHRLHGLRYALGQGKDGYWVSSARQTLIVEVLSSIIASYYYGKTIYFASKGGIYQPHHTKEFFHEKDILFMSIAAPIYIVLLLLSFVGVWGYFLVSLRYFELKDERAANTRNPFFTVFVTISIDLVWVSATMIGKLTDCIYFCKS